MMSDYIPILLLPITCIYALRKMCGYANLTHFHILGPGYLWVVLFGSIVCKFRWFHSVRLKMLRR